MNGDGNRLTTLGAIADFMNGGAWNQAEYSNDGIPVVRVTDIKGETVDLSDCKFLPKRALAKYGKHLLEVGDLVICTVGSHPTQPGSVVGRAAVIPQRASGALLNQNAVRIRSALPDVDQAWLGYLGRSKSFHDYIIGCARGSANQVRMAIGLLKEMPVAVPPLPIQRRIAGILSAYDELIENSQRRIKILEAMARALYREWFVHFRFPGHEGHPRVASALGEIPAGWEVRPFGEFATITMGLSPKGDTYNEDGNGTALINGPVEFGDRYTRQVKWTTAPTKLCNERDLVVCVRGSTTGRYVISDGVYCLGRGVCGISSEFQSFTNLLYTNELPTLLAQTSGSTFPSWTGPQLKSHPVLVPPWAVLERFESSVGSMSDAMLQYSRQIENLRRTRDLLLPRLLAGQIDVEAAQ